MSANVGGGRWTFNPFPNEGGNQINLQIFGKGHEDVYDSSEHPKGEHEHWVAEQIGSVLDEVREEMGAAPARDQNAEREHEILLTKYNQVHMQLLDQSDKATHFKTQAEDSRKTMITYQETLSQISIKLGGTGSSDPKTIIATIQGGLPSRDEMDAIQSQKAELTQQLQKVEAQLKKEQTLRNQAEQKARGAGDSDNLKRQIQDLEAQLRNAKTSSSSAGTGTADPKALQAIRDEYDEKLRRKDMMLNEVKNALQELGFKMGNMDSRTAIPKLKALLSILKKQVDEYKGRTRELGGLVKRKQNRIKYLEKHYHVPENQRTKPIE